MLISPPFLPQRQVNQSDTEWLQSAMICGEPGDGAFPISHQLGWHGGVHLVAPLTDTIDERVRAVSDGTVLFKRAPSSRQSDPNHPLNYRGWTDDGCVVLRHETDIGSGPHAESVVFFSLYIHLSSIHPAVVAGRRVSRKAELGQAGQIYGGMARQIHFEIVCDEPNLLSLVGRSGGQLDLSQDGRADSIYGSNYFLLPSGTQIFEHQPLDYLVAPTRQPPRLNKHAPLPALVPLTPMDTTTTIVVVELQYAGGDGEVGQRGDLVVRSWTPEGEAIGELNREENAEYNLFPTASAISKSFANESGPAPTTVYEMLRYGRRVNPSSEAVIPGNLPHWRKISHPRGEGWVNLNLESIRKFSDADFPPWKGWTFIDDSEDKDSRCDSALVKSWLDTDKSGASTAIECIAAMAHPTVAKKLAKTICNFPSEWTASTIDARWGWLKVAGAQGEVPMSSVDFNELKAHIAALCFSHTEVANATWHLQPLEFIRQFRQCTWFSRNELCQQLPRSSGTSAHTASPISWTTATARLQEYVLPMNLVMRKFGIVSRVRQTHFLAQTYIETGLWRTMEEFGGARQQRRRSGELYWPAPAMQYYQAFFGRGAMQLTWAGNFDAYGKYRRLPNVVNGYKYEDERITQTSTHYWGDPRDRSGNIAQDGKLWFPRYDPHDISSTPFLACDSAGFYWISKDTGHGTLNINRTADNGITEGAIGRASVLVNGGGYGFAERQSYAAYIERYLCDSVGTEASRNFTVTYRNGTCNVYVDFTPQRP